MKKTSFLLLFLLSVRLFAQNPPPVIFTAAEDHQNMMDQLGIKSVRPGPSGTETAPNHANYDESIANPYPVLPDLLTMKNGKKVTTADVWWNQRRPEIAVDMENEVYGRLPNKIPAVKWTVEISEREMIGRIPVIAKKLTGHVDNSECPSIDVNIAMILVTPANVKGPVPVLMMFGGAGNVPAPAQPNRDELAQINKALRQLLSDKDPAIKAIFDKYMAYSPITAAASASPFGGGMGAPAAAAPAPGATVADPPATQQLLAAGWGYATIDPSSIQADNGGGLTKGIIGLVNKGQPRKPEDWGSLRAWAWGAALPLMQSMLELRVFPAMVKQPWLLWLLSSVSLWHWLVHQEKAGLHFIAVTLEKLSKASQAQANITGWQVII